VMDRGIPTDEVLAEMRQSDPPFSYLVGPPKGRLTKLEKALLERPRQAVRDGVNVKLLSDEQELYVLARSRARIVKERAIRRRKPAPRSDGCCTKRPSSVRGHRQARVAQRASNIEKRIERLNDWWKAKMLGEVNGEACRSYVKKRSKRGGARRDPEDLRAAIGLHADEGYHREIVKVSLSCWGSIVVHGRERLPPRRQFLPCRNKCLISLVGPAAAILIDFLHGFQHFGEMLIRQVPTKIPTNCCESKIGPMSRTRHDATTCEAHCQIS